MSSELNPHIARFSEKNPLGAIAIGELSELAEHGQFYSIASSDPERLRSIFAAKSGYWSGMALLYNGQVNLGDEAQLETLVFTTETDEPSRDSFLDLYQQLVVVEQWGFQTIQKETSEEVREKWEASQAHFERWVFGKAITSLAHKGQRLLGGFAVTATYAKPQVRIGQFISSRELYEQCMFYFREGVLEATGTLPISEEEQRNIRTLSPTSIVSELMRTQIIQKLPSENEVLKHLYSDGDTPKSLMETLNAAPTKVSRVSRQVSPEAKRKQARQRAKNARKANRRR